MECAYRINRSDHKLPTEANLNEFLSIYMFIFTFDYNTNLRKCIRLNVITNWIMIHGADGMYLQLSLIFSYSLKNNLLINFSLVI